MDERDQVLADMAALKQVADWYMHPEKPVEVDAAACGRNYFTRPSAPEYEDEDTMDERDQVLADMLLSSKLLTGTCILRNLLRWMLLLVVETTSLDLQLLSMKMRIPWMKETKSLLMLLLLSKLLIGISIQRNLSLLMLLPVQETTLQDLLHQPLKRMKNVNEFLPKLPSSRRSQIGIYIPKSRSFATILVQPVATSSLVLPPLNTKTKMTWTNATVFFQRLWR